MTFFKRPKAFAWMLPSFLVFVSCSCGPSPAGELRAYFDDLFSPDAPGGAVLVMRGDSILFSEGYGLADLGTREPVTSKTLFNVGSVSKTFVANAILILHEEGKLSLDDSVAQYFPDFKHREIAESVKIKHLLNHSSGLPDSRNVSGDSVFYLTARDAENWHPLTQADSLRFEPGARFQYSNPAFNGLALIVEQVSGMPWQKFVRDRIMDPSGMVHSTITDGPHPQHGVAHGYVLDHGEWIEDDYGEEPTFPAAGNGGVWSSVEELALYEKALSRSAFLNASLVRDSRTPHRFENWAGDEPEVPGWSWFEPHIGWSWFVNTTSDGLTVIGHTGTQGGFVANYVTIPERGIFFTILCNTPKDTHAMSDRIMEWLREEGLLAGD